MNNIIEWSILVGKIIKYPEYNECIFCPPQLESKC